MLNSVEQAAVNDAALSGVEAMTLSMVHLAQAEVRQILRVMPTTTLGLARMEACLSLLALISSAILVQSEILNRAEASSVEQGIQNMHSVIEIVFEKLDKHRHEALGPEQAIEEPVSIMNVMKRRAEIVEKNRELDESIERYRAGQEYAREHDAVMDSGKFPGAFQIRKRNGDLDELPPLTNASKLLS